MLGVLTIKLYLLSKPVTPIVSGAVTSRLSMNLRCKDSAKKLRIKYSHLKFYAFWRERETITTPAKTVMAASTLGKVRVSIPTYILTTIATIG